MQTATFPKQGVLTLYRFSAMELSAPILLFFGFSLLVAFYWLIWGK